MRAPASKAPRARGVFQTGLVLIITLLPCSGATLGGGRDSTGHGRSRWKGSRTAPGAAGALAGLWVVAYPRAMGLPIGLIQIIRLIQKRFRDA